MKELSPKDASLLALLAQHSQAPVSKRRMLIRMLGPEGKRVARVIESPNEAKDLSSDIGLTASEIVKWARGNGKNTSFVRLSGTGKKSTSEKVKHETVKVGEGNSFRIVSYSPQTKSPIQTGFRVVRARTKKK